MNRIVAWKGSQWAILNATHGVAHENRQMFKPHITDLLA